MTGVDLSEPGVREAENQARASGRQRQLTFLQADVCEPLPFDAGRFDLIVCLDVLCHLRERGRVFQEWHRVLRPGGRVLVTDPVVVTGLVSKDELAVRSSTGHFEFCPPGVNERLLRAAGFTVEPTDDATEQEAAVSGRWHDARETRAGALIPLEGEETFAGLQRFLATVHRLCAERRLSRHVYLGRKLPH